MILDQLPDEEDLFAGNVAASLSVGGHLLRNLPETVSERK